MDSVKALLYFRTLTAYLFIFLLLVSTCVSGQDAVQEITLRGSVIDWNDQPVANCQIVSYSVKDSQSQFESTFAGDDGSFLLRVNKSPKATGMTYAYKSGYGFALQPTLTKYADGSEFEIGLRPCILRRIRVESDEGVPVRNARIVRILFTQGMIFPCTPLAHWKSIPDFVVQSREDGVLCIPWTDAMEVAEIHVAHESEYGPVVFTLKRDDDKPTGDTMEKLITLRPGIPIRFTFETSSGNQVDWTKCKISVRQAELDQTVFADESGHAIVVVNSPALAIGSRQFAHAAENLARDDFGQVARNFETVQVRVEHPNCIPFEIRIDVDDSMDSLEQRIELRPSESRQK